MFTNTFRIQITLQLAGSPRLKPCLSFSLDSQFRHVKVPECCFCVTFFCRRFFSLSFHDAMRVNAVNCLVQCFSTVFCSSNGGLETADTLVADIALLPASAQIPCCEGCSVKSIYYRFLQKACHLIEKILLKWGTNLYCRCHISLCLCLSACFFVCCSISGCSVTAGFIFS